MRQEAGEEPTVCDKKLGRSLQYATRSWGGTYSMRQKAGEEPGNEAPPQLYSMGEEPGNETSMCMQCVNFSMPGRRNALTGNEADKVRNVQKTKAKSNKRGQKEGLKL